MAKNGQNGQKWSKCPKMVCRKWNKTRVLFQKWPNLRFEEFQATIIAKIPMSNISERPKLHFWAFKFCKNTIYVQSQNDPKMAQNAKCLTCEPSSVPPTIRNPNPESWRWSVTVSSTKDSPPGGLLPPPGAAFPPAGASRGHRDMLPAGKGSLCSKLVLSFRVDRGKLPAR